MQPRTEEQTESPTEPIGSYLRLVVRNHPGVMSHVCGLFARRAFNVEGIICLPLTGEAHSVVLLVVQEASRLEQMIRQLAKLEDVLEVDPAPASGALFRQLARELGTR